MLVLNEPELLAKEHFINLVLKGRDVPIDADDGSTFNFEKPPWFDVDKFELGREYFLENRAGILMTNLAGLILLLTVPKGLAILRGSGRSHTPDLARDRYIDTILHTLTWYDVPLDNSTRSWESLRKVRQMHLYASYNSVRKKLGFISQMEVSMATFGFAGYVLNRPHLFNIQKNSPKKREGFLHLWAVLNYMLGVHDDFNICLLPMKAAQIEFDIIMRNVIGPYLQVETVLFKEMVTALTKGMGSFMPLLNYESQMFMTRRASGIPGYQYRVDISKERPYRNIFSKEDIQRINNPIFSEKIVILTVENDRKSKNFVENKELREDLSNASFYAYEDFNYEKLVNLMGLPEAAKLNVTEVPRDELVSRFDDRNYNKLTMLSKIYVNANLVFIETLGNSVGKFILEEVLNQQFSSMRNFRKERRNS